MRICQNKKTGMDSPYCSVFMLDAWICLWISIPVLCVIKSCRNRTWRGVRWWWSVTKQGGKTCGLIGLTNKKKTDIFLSWQYQVRKRDCDTNLSRISHTKLDFCSCIRCTKILYQGATLRNQVASATNTDNIQTK